VRWNDEKAEKKVGLDNQLIKNHYWTTVKIWIFLTIVSITLSINDMKVHDGDSDYIPYELAFVFTGMVMLLIYSKLARQFDQLLKRHNVLVHWFFTKEEWSQYVKYENRIRSVVTYLIESKEILNTNFFLTLISYREGIVANPYIAFALLIIANLITIGLTSYMSRIKNLAKGYSIAYVLLSTELVSLNGRIYCWTESCILWSGGNRFERVIYIDDIIPPVISLIYSSPGSKGSRDDHKIDIPVPVREKGNVGRIIDEITRVTR
jgi:hypothetical protein